MGPGKPVALLVYLGLTPKGHAARDHVAELFWPGTDLSDARHSLRQSLYRLRQAAGGERLVRAIGTELELSPCVRFDFQEGERAVEAGELPRALELLRGSFLEGFDIAESREFQSWAEAQRARFRDLWARGAERLAGQALKAGDPERALDTAEELAARKPFDDEPMRLVMSALVDSGRHATAVARYHAYVDLLREELEAEPGQELASFAGELEAYLRARPAAGAMLPFVGRAEQWSVLEELWRERPDPDCFTVLIEGAAGLGKSRLITELIGRVRAARGLALAAKCYEIERSVPYSAIAEALAGALERPELARLDSSWLAEAGRLLPELRERFPQLSDPGETPGSQASKRRLHQALCRCFEVYAADGGLLVAIDDIHWADMASLEVLHLLSHRLRDLRVLIVASYRPAELSPEARRFARSLLSGKLAHLVVLDPLSPEHVQEMLTGLGEFEDAGGAELVAGHLHRHSGGNPLFISELLEALERSRVLAVRGGKWRLSRGADIGELPRTLGKLMADRIEALEPWMRACCETLAAAAGEMPVEVLARIVEISEPRAELALGVLEEERLVRRVAASSFELVHDELRRLVYQGVPDDRRKILHEGIGSALESLGEAKRPGGPARLAYHFDQAGDPERTHRYALLAAGEAGALAAPEAERAHLHVAEAHSPKALPPGSERPSRERPGRPSVRRGLVVAGGVGLATAAAGLLWTLLLPSPPLPSAPAPGPITATEPSTWEDMA